MRSAAASSQAMVAAESRPYSIAAVSRRPFDGRSRPAAALGPKAADKEKRGPGERAWGVGAQRVFGHQVAGHSVGPGAAAPALAVHLALPASPAERGAAANVGEQLRGRPQVGQARVAKSPREDRQVGARGDIPVWPYPHVVRPRRAPAGPSGVGPETGQGLGFAGKRFSLPRRSAARVLRAKAGVFQNGLDVVRSALRVDEHPAVVLPLDPVERSKHLVVLRRADVGDELPAPGGHQEVEVPDLGRQPLVGEVGDRLELAEIVRARRRLHDEGEPGPVQDRRALHRVLPSAAHPPEAVVALGIERIEREREPPRPGLRQAPRHVFADAHAVGADDHPKSTLRRAPDDLEDVAP